MTPLANRYGKWPRLTASILAGVALLGLVLDLAEQRTAAADDAGSLAFTAVPAGKSGLAHVLNGDPKLIKDQPIKYPWMSPLVDINGDGHLDVLWYGHHGGGAAVWLGKGDGSFAFDDTGYQSRWVMGGRDPVWWDVNGDGKIDALGTEGTGVAGFLFLNDGSGHWKRTNIGGFAGVPRGCMLVDLDGDGRHRETFSTGGDFQVFEPSLEKWGKLLPEKVAFKPAWKTVEIVGWPKEEPPAVAGPGGPRYHDAFCVDLDGDDRNELIVTFMVGLGCPPERLRSWVLTRDPQTRDPGGWKDATASLGLPTGGGHWFHPEDLNSDGHLDLIDLGSGEWHVNDGKGKFSKAPSRIWSAADRRAGPPWDGDGEIELLDLDNDGRRDLVMSGDHTAKAGVFLNLGGGRFQEVPAKISSSRRNRKFGDVDGDGDLDMVQTAKEQLVLHKNDTSNRGLHVRLVPAVAAEAGLGCKLWVYQAGKLGDPKAVIHHRQYFMERNSGRSNVLDPTLHIGLGQAEAADIRIRFPSGTVRELKAAKARTRVTVREE